MNNFEGSVPTEVCDAMPTIYFCPPLICNCGDACQELESSLCWVMIIKPNLCFLQVMVV